MEPYFESVIRGCFVRIGIGANSQGQSVYRVCEVVGVDARDTAKQVSPGDYLNGEYSRSRSLLMARGERVCVVCVGGCGRGREGYRQAGESW